MTSRAHNSAVEYYLHTVGVAGSNPAAPTTSTRRSRRVFFCRDDVVFGTSSTAHGSFDLRSECVERHFDVSARTRRRDREEIARSEPISDAADDRCGEDAA